jgi:hypothetical protein
MSEGRWMGYGTNANIEQGTPNIEYRSLRRCEMTGEVGRIKTNAQYP